MSTEEYLRPKEVREILKISDKTIYNWEKSGKLTCVRTKEGNCSFLKSDIFPELKENFKRQVKFFQQEFPNHEIVKDIGSGLNSKRKGFISIMG